MLFHLHFTPGCDVCGLRRTFHPFSWFKGDQNDPGGERSTSDLILVRPLFANALSKSLDGLFVLTIYLSNAQNVVSDSNSEKPNHFLLLLSKRPRAGVITLPPFITADDIGGGILHAAQAVLGSLSMLTLEYFGYSFEVGEAAFGRYLPRMPNLTVVLESSYWCYLFSYATGFENLLIGAVAGSCQNHKVCLWRCLMHAR